MTYQPHQSEDATLKPVATCGHRFLTSHGRGWECADCGVGILSLTVPLTMPLVKEALSALGMKGTHDEGNSQC